MRNRIAAWLLLFTLLASLLPTAAIAAPASGVWVLDSIVDKEARDYENTEDTSLQSWIDYTYERGSFRLDWRTVWENYDVNIHDYVAYTGSGTIAASFTGLPERVQPGQTVTVSANMSSSATTDYPDLSESSADSGSKCYAGIVVSTNAENITAYENTYDIPADTYTAGFSQSQSVSFTLPDVGSQESDTAQVTVSLYNPGDIQAMSTQYIYHFVLTAATPSAVLPTGIQLGGLVRSVENKPMPWMKMQAWVFYNTPSYTGSQPDLTVEGVTDHMGRYQLDIPLREGDAQPVGILLVGLLTCQYPFEQNKDLFYFVDMADAASQSSNQTGVCTWLTVNPADAAASNKPEEPIRLNRLLAFYNLGLGSWSFDAELTPDPVYYFSGDAAAAPQMLQDLSALYTAVFDAWFFGAETLREEQAMLVKPLRIEARTPEATIDDPSFYTGADNTIHLMQRNSKRDDASHFIILHEFGHAFDAMTLGTGLSRAAAGYVNGDVNHGGYLNGSTSDSFVEGFATNYAALTQRYSGYPNPEKIDWVNIATPSDYKAWGSYSTCEEMAIASLLYYAHDLIADTAAYWSLLKPDRLNFAEYYAAIKGALPADAAQKLDDYAYDAGLFKMPFGNSQYDKGEPFTDTNKNTIYDAGEPYADLMFDVGTDGEIDASKPLKTFDKAKLSIGTVSAAGITRQSVPVRVDSSLALTGTLPEYLLVDIATDAGSTCMLRAVYNNGVFLGLPELPAEGTITVSVPGGNMIYTGDIAALQAQRNSQYGQAIALDTAEISPEDLAPEGTQVVAVYGTANAAGVLEIPEMTSDELDSAAQGYNPTATLEEVAAAFNSAGNQNVDAGSDNDIISTPEPDMDYGYGTGSALQTILIIAVVLTVIAAAVIMIIVLAKRGKKQNLNPQINRGQPYAPGIACPACGAPTVPGSSFCENCGRQMPVGNQPAMAFCTGCGAPLKPGARFCANCRHPVGR